MASLKIIKPAGEGLWVPASHEHRRCGSLKCCALDCCRLGWGWEKTEAGHGWCGLARQISRLWPSSSSTALLLACENSEQSHVWAQKLQHGYHKNQTHAKSPDAANSKHPRARGSGWKPETNTELCCYYPKKKKKSAFGTDCLSHIQTYVSLQ